MFNITLQMVKTQELFVWLVVRLHGKDEWKRTYQELGEVFVIVTGMTMMPGLHADKWDIQLVVSNPM